MLYSGKFLYKGNIYSVNYVETDNGKRVDISTEELDPYILPTPENLICSYVESLSENNRYIFGDLDLYYAYERIKRESRIFMYEKDQIEEEDVFEEGEIRYIVKYKDTDYEYHFDSVFLVKQNYFYRVREDMISISLISEDFSNISTHQMLRYNPVETTKSTVDADGLLLSRIATLNDLREKYDLSWMNEKEYVWMEDEVMLKKYLLQLKAHIALNPKTAIVAFDTETTGLNVYNLPNVSGKKDKLVSIVLTWKVGFAIYIPLRHKYEKNLDEQRVMKLLYPYLSLVPILTQYGVFDLKTLIEFELEGKNIPFRANIREDLLIENYIIDPNPNRGSRGLKDQVHKHLNIKQLSLSDLFPPTADGKKQEIKFELLGKELSLFYACPDVDLLLECHKIVRPQIPKISEAIYNIEIGFMPISAEAEYYGLKIDMKQFYYEKKLCETLAEYLENVIYQLAGYKFNINSPDQVSDLLYNKLGCEKLVTSPNNPNKGSTSSKALKELSKVKRDDNEERFKEPLIQHFRNEKGEPDKRVILEKETLNEARYPLILVLRKYRDVNKLITGFFNSIEDSNQGGVLFSWVNQTGAQTGRIISPLQTLPPYIKKMIIPDTSEHGWIVMDYKQVELRLMFGISKEHTMIEQAKDPDKDIHRIIGAGIYKTKIWEVFKKIRDLSKGLNFGIPYQLGIPNLAKTLYGFTNSAEKTKQNEERAAKDRADYFALMPRVERMFQDTKYLIAKYGMIYTYLGRRYVYPTIFTETDRGKISKILRQGGNARIQGLGADTFKYGCVELDKAFREKNWHHLVEVVNEKTGEYEGKYPKVRESFFVHDELGVNYHKKTINPLQILYLMRKHMEVELKGFPPLYIGPAVVKNWAEAKKDKYEIPTQLLYKWCDEVEQGMHTEPLENPEEWVFNEIEKYHEINYRKYFGELIEQLELEGKEVTKDNIKKIFRHDTLTHHLMSTFGADMYEKETGHQPSDIEWLEWAVTKYIDSYNIIEDNQERLDTLELESNPYSSLSDFLLDEKEFQFTSDEDEEEDDELLMRELADEHEEYARPLDVVDRFGFEDDTTGELSDTFYKYSMDKYDIDDYTEMQEALKESYSSYIDTLGRVKYITLDGVKQGQVNMLVEYLKDNHLDDGLYEVSFVQAMNIIDTEFKVDKIDEALVELILKDKINI